MCMHTLSIALFKELLILEVPIQQQTIKGDLIAHTHTKIHRKAIRSIQGKDTGYCSLCAFLENFYFHLLYFIDSMIHDFSFCNTSKTRMHLKIASKFDWPRSK